MPPQSIPRTTQRHSKQVGRCNTAVAQLSLGPWRPARPPVACCLLPLPLPAARSRHSRFEVQPAFCLFDQVDPAAPQALHVSCEVFTGTAVAGVGV